MRLLTIFKYRLPLGGGFNYSFTEHLMAEFGFNFTAGYGESELNPANDYVPFLYSGFFSMAYRF